MLPCIPMVLGGNHHPWCPPSFVDFKCLWGADSSGIGWRFQSLEDPSIDSLWTPNHIELLCSYSFCSFYCWAYQHGSTIELLSKSSVHSIGPSIARYFFRRSRSSQDNPNFPTIQASASLAWFSLNASLEKFQLQLGRPEIQGSNLAESSRVFQFFLVHTDLNLRYPKVEEVPCESLVATNLDECPEPCHLWLRHWVMALSHGCFNPPHWDHRLLLPQLDLLLQQIHLVNPLEFISIYICICI